MKTFQFITSHCLFIEIGQSSLKVLHGDDGLEWSLERQENGRLSSACKERLTGNLRNFLKNKNSWLSRPRAFCAIGARGVSLRRLTLPASTNEELQRLLALQIESEFPLPPDELAWGYCQLTQGTPPRNATAAGQELIVVAVKKEVIDEYAEILSDCGLSPVFTLGALARSSLCPKPFGSYAVLDIGRNHSELISFDDSGPSTVRILPWGGENLTRSIENNLAISHGEAESLKVNLEHPFGSNVELGQKIQVAIRAELSSLAGSISGNGTIRKIFLTGRSTLLKDLALWLGDALGGGVECERIAVGQGEGRSAAILGLKRFWETGGVGAPLIIQAKQARSAESLAQPAQWKWAALAVLLAVGSLALRYAEPILLKPRLSRKIAEIKAYKQRLPNIDRELGFLQFLKTNQPPCLDALFILANSAPPGTRIDSLSMNRSGDLTLRGSMQNPQQVVEFRSKLIDSGFFSTVVPEEQTPTPDRQKVTVRIIAQWKPSGVRESLPSPIAPSKEFEKTKPPRNDVKPDGSAKTNAPSPAAPKAVPRSGAAEPRARSAELHSAVSQISNLPAVENPVPVRQSRRPAGSKSAIQPIENLRSKAARRSRRILFTGIKVEREHRNKIKG